MNSIIIPHRNRPQHLHLCLKALGFAAEHKIDHEVIIVEQSDTPPDLDIPKHLNVSILSEPLVPPPYNKSAAINHGVQAAQGEIITLLDVDCLAPRNFLIHIDGFFKLNEGAMKLGHRVRLLDNATTKDCLDRQNTRVYMHPRQPFPIAAETYKDMPIGCGIWSMHKDVFEDIGMFREDFKGGWGLEDVELNCRAFHCGVETHILTDSSHDLFHLAHKRTPDWHTTEGEKANRDLFLKLESDGFPPPVSPGEGVYYHGNDEVTWVPDGSRRK